MNWRAVPPVLSSVTPAALAEAAVAAANGGATDRLTLAGRLEEEFGADRVLLTDSGTSALVLALRLLVGAGGTVAYPGYACVDLAAAALFAGVRVRLYDLDPNTLSPDLDSVDHALRRGVSAVVVVHFFGFPADVAGVQDLAAAHGAKVIEDAAQGAGGRMAGRRLGTQTSAAILSFGRGKGTTGGGGGALLLRGASAAATVWEQAPVAPGGRGWSSLFTSVAQLALGQPTLYAIPRAIPQLRLGEMVYHPAREPQGIGGSSARLVLTALDRTDHDVAVRTAHAAELGAGLSTARGVLSVHPLKTATPGFLRLPMRLVGEADLPGALGVVRPYPRALHDQVELSPVLVPGEPPTPGAAELASRLVTMPTHAKLSPGDVGRLVAWGRSVG